MNTRSWTRYHLKDETMYLVQLFLWDPLVATEAWELIC